MDFIELARSRYSCKSFDSRQISKEQLDSILEAGRLAPTAKNLQEQHVYVVQSAEGLVKVDALTPCRYGAPTMLIVAFDKNNVFTYPGQKYDSGIEDATIVTTHMMLCAKSVGVLLRPRQDGRSIPVAGERRDSDLSRPRLSGRRRRAAGQPQQPQAD